MGATTRPRPHRRRPAAADLSHIPHAQAIGLRVVDARPDEAWLESPTSESLVGNPETGVVHAASITNAPRQRRGHRGHPGLEEPRSIASSICGFDYMKPATPGPGHRRLLSLLQGDEERRVRPRVAYHDAGGRPIATMVATFMLGANWTLPAVFARRPEVGFLEQLRERGTASD